MVKIRKTIQETQDNYNIIASHFGQTRRVLWQDLKPFLAEVGEKDKVLDLGCGNGRLLLALQEKKIDYIGVDLSEQLIKQARTRFPKATFVVADITRKKFWQSLRGKKFDQVFLIAVLHHFSTPKLQKQLIKKIRGVLKNDGQLFLTVWNLYQQKFWFKYLKQLPRQIFSGFKFKWLWIPYRLSDGRKIKREVFRFCYAFTKKELENLLKRTGFKIEEIYYSKKGKKTGWRQGFNLCLIARK